jgi:uncharacterized membrane protein YbaN (DUF454 family)
MARSMRKALWFALGILLLILAYIGVIVPGIPWSTPVVGAAYCFSKSSNKFHNWLYSHRLFGPFLTGWEEKKIFPTKMKYFMLATMSTSLLILWFGTGSLVATSWLLGFMLLVVVWGWRYPGSHEEHARRVNEGKRVAWLK